MSMDIDHSRRWIGRAETLTDSVTPAPLRALTATLDRDDAPQLPGDAIPPCWPWLDFLPTARHSEIGPDGHPRRGGFLPPVPLPRRLWAGSRVGFTGPMRVGQAIERSSRIDDVRLKEGRSGPRVFVKVRHEIRADRVLAVATLRLDLLRRELPRARVTHVAFRAHKPLFDIAPLEVCGRRVDEGHVAIRALTPEGHLAMDARVTPG